MKKLIKKIILIEESLLNSIFYKPRKIIKRKLKNRFNRVSKFFIFKILYPLIYNMGAKKPIQEDKVVFVEARLGHITNSLEVIFNELVENYNFDIHTHFLRISYTKKRESTKRALDLLRDISTAKYIFISEANNVVSSINLRPETKCVQLWHGCGAFKKFGFSTAELIFGATKKNMEKFPYYKNLSLITVSSPNVVWAYEEAMGIMSDDEIVKSIGVSRTDIFYNNEFIENAYKNLYQLFPNAIGKKVILYAPTFRGRVANGQIEDLLNFKIFKEELGDKYVLINKYHPLIRKRPKIPLDCDDFAKDYTNTMSIEELICVSDICISNYSSLIFEYSLFEKPILFFAYDLDNYLDWRGFYYNYEDLTPGPIFNNNLDMINYIKSVDINFDKTNICDFKNKFMSSCDGHSTERILSCVFGDALKKYKRKNNLLHAPYHLIPQSKYYYSKYDKKINELLKTKKTINFYYNKSKSIDIQENLTVLLMDERFSVICKYMEEELNNFFEVHIVKSSNLRNELKLIAKAKFIVTFSDYKELRLLNLREETKVIRIPKESFLFNKVKYSSIKSKVAYLKDYQKISRLNYDYDLIPVMSTNLIGTYNKNFNIEKSRVIATGSIRLDILRNEKFVISSKNKLLSLFPNLINKKIILYLPFKFDKYNKRYQNDIIDYQLMFEYLQKEYVILIDYGDNNKNSIINDYFSNFIIDITGKFNDLEMESLADIAIGDFRNELFEISLLEKPVYLFLNQCNEGNENIDFNFSYNNVKCGVVVRNTHKLIEHILIKDPIIKENSTLFNRNFKCTYKNTAVINLITAMEGIK